MKEIRLKNSYHRNFDEFCNNIKEKEFNNMLDDVLKNDNKNRYKI